MRKLCKCGENRKGCVMSFPYQCLATAALTSCPAGLAGICRLTSLPSPYTPNTHTHTHIRKEPHSWSHGAHSLAGAGSLTSLSPSIIHRHTLVHHLKAGGPFPFRGPPALHILPFLSKWLFLKSSSAFHRKAIREAFKPLRLGLFELDGRLENVTGNTS